jgi:hypothetical protein
MLATPEDVMVGTMLFASLTNAVTVAMEQWSEQHHAFTVKMFFNGDSAVKIQ